MNLVTKVGFPPRRRWVATDENSAMPHCRQSVRESRPLPGIPGRLANEEWIATDEMGWLERTGARRKFISPWSRPRKTHPHAPEAKSALAIRSGQLPFANQCIRNRVLNRYRFCCLRQVCYASSGGRAWQNRFLLTVTSLKHGLHRPVDGSPGRARDHRQPGGTVAIPGPPVERDHLSPADRLCHHGGDKGLCRCDGHRGVRSGERSSAKSVIVWRSGAAPL